MEENTTPMNKKDPDSSQARTLHMQKLADQAITLVKHGFTEPQTYYLSIH